jgi:hypothetical protein
VGHLRATHACTERERVKHTHTHQRTQPACGDVTEHSRNHATTSATPAPNLSLAEHLTKAKQITDPSPPKVHQTSNPNMLDNTAIPIFMVQQT